MRQNKRTAARGWTQTCPSHHHHQVPKMSEAGENLASVGQAAAAVVSRDGLEPEKEGKEASFYGYRESCFDPPAESRPPC